MTLHIATQWLHQDLGQIAPCLGLPVEKVRLVMAGVGGAFGAREDVSLQIHACLLALATKRPVRMSYGREESFYGHVHRHPARLFYRHTATRDGRLVSVRATIVLDGGGYASSSPAVIANAACFAAGPYRVPNAEVWSVGAYTNNPPAGAMRGFGAVQTCFAYEAQMDKLAVVLGMDPVALRERNGLVDGDPIITGQPVTGAAGVPEVIRRTSALPPPDERRAASIELPGGAGNLTLGEGVVRGVGFAAASRTSATRTGSTTRARRGSGRARRERRARPAHSAAAEVGQGVVTVQAPDRAQRARHRAGHRGERRHDDRIGRLELGFAPDLDDRRRGEGRLRSGERRARPARRRRGIRRDDLAALVAEAERTVTYRHRPTAALRPGRPGSRARRLPLRRAPRRGRRRHGHRPGQGASRSRPLRTSGRRSIPRGRRTA